MVDPYDVILSPWITEKSLNARRVADLKDTTRKIIIESNLLYDVVLPRQILKHYRTIIRS